MKILTNEEKEKLTFKVTGWRGSTCWVLFFAGIMMAIVMGYVFSIPLLNDFCRIIHYTTCPFVVIACISEYYMLERIVIEQMNEQKTQQGS